MKLSRLACATAFLAFAGPGAIAQSPSSQAPEPDETETDTQEDSSSLGMSGDGEEEEGSGSTFQEQSRATLRALDKITGRSTDFEIEVGAPMVYGSLKIDLETCFQTPPEEPPESAAFLQIATTEDLRMNSVTEPRLAGEVDRVGASGIDAKALARAEQDARASDQETPLEEQLLFSGWMFASSPGLSALEHPVYDVWVIRCTQRSPDNASSPADPAE